MITWEPWGKATGNAGAVERPKAVLDVIASGRYDDYITSWARSAARHGGPLLLRPMHLMNGDAYPWSVGVNGNTDRDFVRAWRHIHGIFASEGARNVGWVWSVNTFGSTPGVDGDVTRYYPGDAYVDWVSMSGFNWGGATPWGTWRSFDDIFEETYRALASLSKPVMISEIATSTIGGDAGAWVRNALARLREAYPRVRAVVWFDARLDGEVDFRLRDQAAAALRQELAATPYFRAAPNFVSAVGASRESIDAGTSVQTGAS